MAALACNPHAVGSCLPESKLYLIVSADAGEYTANAAAARAIKNVRSLRKAVSMTSGPERPDADEGDR